jgi:hypothetical protein
MRKIFLVSEEERKKQESKRGIRDEREERPLYDAPWRENSNIRISNSLKDKEPPWLLESCGMQSTSRIKCISHGVTLNLTSRGMTLMSHHCFGNVQQHAPVIAKDGSFSWKMNRTRGSH